MNHFLLVGLGGAVGSMARYGVAVLMSQTQTLSVASVLTVNILGSALIGILSPFLIEQSPSKLILVVGFLGGFTTFSSFAWEARELFIQHGAARALFYVLGTNVGCLLVCALGALLAARFR